MECQTPKHKGKQIIGICLTKDCPYHLTNLVCEFCALQCPDKQSIILLKDQIANLKVLSEDQLKKADYIIEIMEKLIFWIKQRKQVLDELKSIKSDTLTIDQIELLRQNIDRSPKDELALTLDCLSDVFPLLEQFITSPEEFKNKHLDGYEDIITKKVKIEKINLNTKMTHKRQAAREKLSHFIKDSDQYNTYEIVLNKLEKFIYNKYKSCGLLYRQDMKQLEKYLSQDKNLITLYKISKDQITYEQASLLMSSDWSCSISQEVSDL